MFSIISVPAMTLFFMILYWQVMLAVLVIYAVADLSKLYLTIRKEKEMEEMHRVGLGQYLRKKK